MEAHSSISLSVVHSSTECHVYQGEMSPPVIKGAQYFLLVASRRQSGFFPHSVPTYIAGILPLKEGRNCLWGRGNYHNGYVNRLYLKLHSRRFSSLLHHKTAEQCCG